MGVLTKKTMTRTSVDPSKSLASREREKTFRSMPTRPSILEVERLSVTRNGTRILQKVDWTIRQGEHWVLMGANGSGKTTLLSSLLGYFVPTAGSIQLLGETYGEGDWRELRQRLGVVSSSLRELMPDEEPALHTVISGKYAMIDLWEKPKAEDVKQAKRILRQIECLSLAHRPWSVLSQGERQRILIGRALMAGPELLVLDEPCAGLDPAAREHFLQFLERLHGKPKSPSFVLVTHHVEEITPLYTHMLTLRKGRVVASGPLAKILSSETLSRTFGTPMKLRKRPHGWQAEAQPYASCRRIL